MASWCRPLSQQQERHQCSRRKFWTGTWWITIAVLQLSNIVQSFSIASSLSLSSSSGSMSEHPQDPRPQQEQGVAYDRKNDIQQSTTATDNDNLYEALLLLSKLPKSHALTVCLVPPPDRTDIWMQLQDMRRQLRDPGLYRWPPHVNLLYPFVTLKRKKKRTNNKGNSQDDKDNAHDSVEQNEKELSEGEDLEQRDSTTQYQENLHDGEEDQVEDDSMIWERLRRATEACPPFWMTLHPFGTFGGNKRGVLWLYPTTNFHDPSVLPTTMKVDTDDSLRLPEPILYLHSLLQEQFPMCQAPGPSNAFHPHMTLSHFVNLTQAQDAQAQLELQQQRQQQQSLDDQNSSSSPPTPYCLIQEIYVLQRRGDEGQFQRIATLPLLGKTLATANRDATGNSRSLERHSPPLPFPGMPLVEEDWVRTERKQLQQRRNSNGRRRRR